MGRGYRNFEVLVRKSLHCIEEIVCRNTDNTGISGEDSEKRREIVQKAFTVRKDVDSLQHHEENVDRCEC